MTTDPASPATALAEVPAALKGPGRIPSQNVRSLLTLPSSTPADLREMIESLPEPLRTAVIAAVNQLEGVRVTFGNAKGGVEKSTGSVYFALMLALTGQPVLLVDNDETNKTCLKWEASAGEDWPPNVTVIGCSGAMLTKKVADMMGHGYRHLVIDVGPSDLRALKAAWALTRKGIVPTQQHVGDVVQLHTTFDLLPEMAEEITLNVLIGKSFPNRRSFREARQHIEDMIAGKAREDDEPLPNVSLLTSTVPLLEEIADTWGSIPEDFSHFAWVMAEMLGVPPAVIAERVNQAREIGR